MIWGRIESTWFSFLVVWCRCLFSVYDKIYTHLGHALLWLWCVLLMPCFIFFYPLLLRFTCADNSVLSATLYTFSLPMIRIHLLNFSLQRYNKLFWSASFLWVLKLFLLFLFSRRTGWIESKAVWWDEFGFSSPAHPPFFAQVLSDSWLQFRFRFRFTFMEKSL